MLPAAAVPTSVAIASDSTISSKATLASRGRGRGIMKASKAASTLPNTLTLTDSNKVATRIKKHTIRSVIEEFEFIHFGVAPEASAVKGGAEVGAVDDAVAAGGSAVVDVASACLDVAVSASGAIPANDVSKTSTDTAAAVPTSVAIASDSTISSKATLADSKLGALAMRRDMRFYYRMILERRLNQVVPAHSSKVVVPGQPKQAVVGLSRPMMSSRGRGRGIMKASKAASTLRTNVLVADPNKGTPEQLEYALRSKSKENQLTNFGAAAVPTSVAIASDSTISSKATLASRGRGRGIMKASKAASTLPNTLTLTDSNKVATRIKKHTIRSVIEEFEFIHFGVAPEASAVKGGAEVGAVDDAVAAGGSAVVDVASACLDVAVSASGAIPANDVSKTSTDTAAAVPTSVAIASDSTISSKATLADSKLGALAMRRDMRFYYRMILERRLNQVVPAHSSKVVVPGQPKQAVVGLSRPMMSSRGRGRGIMKASKAASTLRTNVLVADPNKGTPEQLEYALRSKSKENQLTNFGAAAVPTSVAIASDSTISSKATLASRGRGRGTMKASKAASTLPNTLTLTDSNKVATRIKKHTIRSVIEEFEFIHFGVLPPGHREPELIAPTSTAIATATAPTVAAQTVPTPAVTTPPETNLTAPRDFTGGNPVALGRGRARGLRILKK